MRGLSGMGLSTFILQTPTGRRGSNSEPDSSGTLLSKKLILSRDSRFFLMLPAVDESCVGNRSNSGDNLR